MAVPMACQLEATAPKVGNVHPRAAFDGMNYTHFVASAIAVARCTAGSSSVGRFVHDAALATHTEVGCNTNLGTLLLFGPIVCACSRVKGERAELRVEVERVLAELTAEDSRLVYSAIRIAKPGGMGRRKQDDIQGEPPQDLVGAMQQVAHDDAVARQYTQGFSDVFERLLPWFDQELERAKHVVDAICRLQIRWLAEEPDGLIVRKVGRSEAEQICARAQQLWCECRRTTKSVLELDTYAHLDSYLRADGNRRNPGTTADLIAATILVRLLGAS